MNHLTNVALISVKIDLYDLEQVHNLSFVTFAQAFLFETKGMLF